MCWRTMREYVFADRLAEFRGGELGFLVDPDGALDDVADEAANVRSV